MTNDKDTKNGVPQTKQAILPLTGTTAPPLDKNNSRIFDLQTQPGQPNSPTYKMTARVLEGDEDLRCKIIWARDIQAVMAGLNVTDLIPRLPLVKTLMSTTCHGSFISALDELAQKRFDDEMDAAVLQDAANNNTTQVDALNQAGVTRHTDDVIPAIQVMLKGTLPFKTLQKVKRHLRRNCRKPSGMKIRTYANHLNRINVEELPNIPPRDPNNKLSTDEIIDILLFGTPKSWQREMDRQGFDPIAESYNQVVLFMERIEESEEPQNESQKKNNSSKKDNNKRKPSNNSEKKSDDSSGNKKFCLLHGEGNHTSDECYTLKNQAKKLKSDGTSPDKDKKKSDKESMAAQIGKAVREGIRKELNALKLKASEEEEGEVNAAELDLSEFNYEDMENLNIDDISC